MPCRDDWPVDYHAIQKENIEYNRLLDRNDELAALLCATCALLDKAGLLAGKDAGPIRQWYRKHQKFDKSRKEDPRRRSERYPGTCSVSSSNPIADRVRRRR